MYFVKIYWHFRNWPFWEVDISGVDVWRADILGVDIPGVDILGRTPSNRFPNFSQQLHKMSVQQLKRRRSSGSLNTGVQTKKIETSRDNLKRFNIHMEMKTTKNLLYLHPLNLPERGQNFTVVGLWTIATPLTDCLGHLVFHWGWATVECSFRAERNQTQIRVYMILKIMHFHALCEDDIVQLSLKTLSPDLYQIYFRKWNYSFWIAWIYCYR